MGTDTDDNFLPADPVSPRMVHRALVMAAGLGDVAAGLDAIHTRDGTAFELPPDFGTLLVGMRVGLRHDHSDESLELLPDTPLSRAEVAWSLFRVATVPERMHDSLSPYGTITLPDPGPARRRIVQFGIDSGTCMAASGTRRRRRATAADTSPSGGFDRSGFTWWVMKASEGGWDNARLATPPAGRCRSGARPTWHPPAADREAPGHPGRGPDVLRRSGDGVADHVNVYTGNGWALDTSDGAGG